MKKAFSIFLLSLHLLAATDFMHLHKMPILVQHFFEHQLENSDITFIDFLAIHYFNGNVKDADFERDMQLPFKQADAHSLSFIYIAPDENQSMPTNVYEENYQNFDLTHLSVSPNTTDERAISTQYLSEIWNPPKA